MQTYTPPANPIAAVTHANPYPYYAELVANKPIYYDQALGCWVASSADAVRAVLSSELCRVRPPTEPVPHAIVESPAADIFKHLVRMNDGEKHRPYKDAVSSTLGSLDMSQAAIQSSKWARHLFNELRPDLKLNCLSEFSFQLPVYVVASLLRVPEKHLPQVVHWISEYIACLAPNSTPAQIEQGGAAASCLLDLFHALLMLENEGMLATLGKEAKYVGRDEVIPILANAIGFLTQAYEATAGLIGNTWVMLAADNQLRDQITDDTSLLRNVVQEALRYDSPVQNTRRWLAQDGVIAGQNMHEGDMILVILAAANHDPSVNPNPQQFDIFRSNRQLFTFGVGVHACPGKQLASTIATAGVQQLLAADLRLNGVSYRPSGNTRIPLFEALGV